MKYNTRILHSDADKDPRTGALSIPLYPASTYGGKPLDEMQKFNYSRSGNPTRKALEENLAALESAAAGYAFSSGMAAITSVPGSGDNLIVIKDILG